MSRNSLVVAFVVATLIGCGGKAPAVAPPDPPEGPVSPTTPTSPTTPPTTPVTPPDGVPTCIPAKDCQVQNPCHIGFTGCTASGDEVCVDSGQKSDGYKCGDKMVCSAGECVAEPVPPPQFVSFTATPAQINQGSGSTLKVVVTGAQTLACDHGAALTSGVDLTVFPSATTTYGCTATNADGKSVSDNVTVTVIPTPVNNPSIQKFTASSLVTSPGLGVILSPVFKDGTGTINTVGTVASGGSVSVGPTVDTTYTLTVTGAPGTTPATAKVNVVVAASSRLESNTSLMVANGINYPTLTVHFYNSSGVEITDLPYVVVTSNGQSVNASHFTTLISGDYTLHAQSGDLKSNTVKITAQPNTNYATLRIPYRFIIAHAGEPVGVGTNLGADQIQRLIDLKNAADNNHNGSVDPNAFSMNIESRLVKRDPAGNLLPEPGIIRVDRRLYDVGGGISGEDVTGDGLLGTNEAFRLLADYHWDERLCVTILIAPTATLVNGQLLRGYSISSLPWAYDGHGIQGLTTYPDGSNIQPSRDTFYYTRLDTDQREWAFTHEDGHQVKGLLHVFSWSGCLYDDYADDTFTYDLVTGAACPTNRGVSDHNNYMDYYNTKTTHSWFQVRRARKLLGPDENGQEGVGIWINKLQYSTL